MVVTVTAKNHDLLARSWQNCYKLARGDFESDEPGWFAALEPLGKSTIFAMYPSLFPSGCYEILLKRVPYMYRCVRA